MIKREQDKGQFFDYENEPSLTIPDQTMSMRTIMERYAKGLPITNVKTPIYDEENVSSGVDLRKLDLVDIQEMGMEHKKTISDYKTSEARKLKQKQNDDLEKIIQERIAKSNNNT